MPKMTELPVRLAMRVEDDALMSACMADMIEEMVGERPTMEVRSAPEHERSENA